MAAADGAAKSAYIEARQAVVGAGTDLGLRVDFAEAIASGSVSSNPALTSLTATPNGNSLDITFDAPAPGTCYSFDITGTAASSGNTADEGNGTADADFCVCYFEADINADSSVDFVDRGVVTFPQNFNQDYTGTNCP